MTSRANLLNALKQLSVPVVGTIIEDFEAEINYVFVEVVRDRENKQKPSNLSLRAVKQQLAESGFNVEFLLADQIGKDLEIGLRATLLMAFGNELRNVFLSIEKRRGKVWIEPKTQFGERVERAISKTIEIYLSNVDVTLESLIRTTDENLPSILACLNRIKLHAPVTQTVLLRDLVSRGFTVPSEDWLKRRLDTIRRAGKIVRLSDGGYVLTLASLRALGTLKNGSKSPDVTRMLALARRCG